MCSEMDLTPSLKWLILVRQRVHCTCWSHNSAINHALRRIDAHDLSNDKMRDTKGLIRDKGAM